jgi:hypothetical protein
MLHTHTFRRLLASIALVAATSACGDVIRQGRSPVVLVIDRLTGTAGGSSGGTPSGTLRSDVVVNRTSPAPCTPASPCPTIFDDGGQATIHLAPKNISLDLAPTTNNQVTITRYHVTYRRADGRNTPGVDVPFGFDGAVTATVPETGSTVTLDFELVRHVAKEESPLVQLVNSPNIINTIAEITFYGTDLVGNAVSVTGLMSIEFGNFGDQ